MSQALINLTPFADTNLVLITDAFVTKYGPDALAHITPHDTDFANMDADEQYYQSTDTDEMAVSPAERWLTNAIGSLEDNVKDGEMDTQYPDVEILNNLEIDEIRNMYIVHTTMQWAFDMIHALQWGLPK